jgi:hypothetical protein
LHFWDFLVNSAYYLWSIYFMNKDFFSVTNSAFLPEKEISAFIL